MFAGREKIFKIFENFPTRIITRKNIRPLLQGTDALGFMAYILFKLILENWFKNVMILAGFLAFGDTPTDKIASFSIFIRRCGGILTGHPVY